MKRWEENSLELYNLAEDIGEERNLASIRPQRASELEFLLMTYIKDVKALLPKPKNQETEEIKK